MNQIGGTAAPIHPFNVQMEPTWESPMTDPFDDPRLPDSHNRRNLEEMRSVDLKLAWIAGCIIAGVLVFLLVFGMYAQNTDSARLRPAPTPPATTGQGAN